MGYGAVHLDGASDDSMPIASFRDLYAELSNADGEHSDVAVIDDDTGWGVVAYRNGLVIFQCLADGTAFHMRDVPEDRVIEMWTKLANGEMDALRALAWKDGFK